MQRQLPTTSAAAIIFDRAFTPSFKQIQVRDRDYLRKPSTYHQCTGSEDLNYQFSANLLIHGVLTPGLNFVQRSCVFSHITQWLSLCFPGMEHRPVGSLLNFEVMVGSRTISTYSSQPMRLWADIFFPALHHTQCGPLLPLSHVRVRVRPSKSMSSVNQPCQGPTRYVLEAISSLVKETLSALILIRAIRKHAQFLLSTLEWRWPLNVDREGY